MKLIWTSGAANDLEEVADFIRKDKPEAAIRVARIIYDTILQLEFTPYRGRRREEDTSLELVVPSLPYIVLYEVIGNAVFIKAIRHTSRDWS